MDQTSGSVITEEWSVHAQLVVHQPSRTPSGDGGVRMEYSWEPSVSSIWETASRPSRPTYGFHKGSLLFTTSPPQCGINRLAEQTAGHSQTFPRYPARSPPTATKAADATPVFTSEKFNTLPSRRPTQQYERRCRSTCSITLSCDVPQAINRTQSMRSSSGQCTQCGKLINITATPNANTTATATASATAAATTTDANLCEDCRIGKRANRSHTFTTHFCTHVLNDEKNIKDASSQTAAEETSKPNEPKKDFLKPEIVVPEGPKFKGERKKVTRSPARLRGKSPLLAANTAVAPPAPPAPPPQEKDAKKQPRTVHIDVYCTGSDEADDSGSPSSDEDPQTVFENQNLRVVHRRAGRRELPNRRKKGPSSFSFRKKASDDELSSQYPSAQSSRTTLMESFGSLLTDQSTALCSDDTSWKDTDIGSVQQSGVSLIDGSLTQSDSFEYADSIDKQRIKQLENKLSGNGNGDGDKTWKSPQKERKTLLREKIFNDYLQSHMRSFPLWKSSRQSKDSSDSDDSHDSEIGWTFSHGSEDSNRKRDNSEVEKPTKSAESGSLSDSAPSTVYRFKRRAVLGPFGVRPPSPLPAKLENTTTTPFSPSLRETTECFTKAQKFGTIVNSLKKPGHHVGPAKNPDCTCKSCTWYFEENKGRGRTRSVGDVPLLRRPKNNPEPETASLREELSELMANQWDLIQNLV